MAATFSARDATANPRLATPAVARAAARHGATILENTRVTAANQEGAGFALSLADGNRLSCGALVNCAGAWALAIAERFGETAPVFPAGPPQFVTEPFPYRIEPSVQAIRTWIKQADRDDGRATAKPAAADAALSAAERDELTRLRREVRQLRVERDILSRAAAWFARETGTIPSGSSGS